MREILFRGKTEQGKWIFGFYHNETSIESPASERKITRHHIYTKDFDKFVIPETVGQYTGLTDKNGNKIFEGDIVSTKYKLGRGGYYVFEVYYNENLCQFALTINSGSYTKNKQYDWLQLTSLKANKVEIIGNIHDNPELLEV